MPTPPRALVVDDSDAIRRLLVHALERLGGLACTEARDGAEALRCLAAAAFDVVLTDLHMPRMDGLKLIGHIRRGGARADVPIVVLTTASAEEDRRRALALGASRYLVKPVQPQAVVQAVRELLPRAPEETPA